MAVRIHIAFDQTSHMLQMSTTDNSEQVKRPTQERDTVSVPSGHIAELGLWSFCLPRPYLWAQELPVLVFEQLWVESWCGCGRSPVDIRLFEELQLVIALHLNVTHVYMKDNANVCM